MKKILLTIFILLSMASHSDAQITTRRIPPADENPEPGDAFLGEWEWRGNGEIFHISIWRDRAFTIPHDPQRTTVDVILGNFTYSRNGIVIAQSNTPAHPIPGLIYSTVDFSELRLRFFDADHNKLGLTTLRFVSSTRNQITWELQKVEQQYYGQRIPPAATFSVPTSLVLTRQ